MTADNGQILATGIREQLRLSALDSYGITNTKPEPIFDSFVQRAAARFGAPISLISLIDESRQWFKARVGLDVPHTPREIAFCLHAIASKKPFVVPDALADERFATNPLVSGRPHIRFYAGAPLITPLGRALGTINVIDIRPRHDWSAADTDELAALASEVMTVLEKRRGDLVRERARNDVRGVGPHSRPMPLTASALPRAR